MVLKQGGVMKRLGLIALACTALSLSSPAFSAEESMLLENERNSVSVFEKTADSVVNVSNLKKVRSFFEVDANEVQSGMGSGVVWDDSGHIVTNFHVIDGADSYTVTFKGDSKSFKAKFIGGDRNNDIAVLKLLEMPKNLKPITLGDSKSLKVGQKTLAIGNPLGLDHTLTTGSVSALDRKIQGYGGVSITGMIQTDASINPGNSGGALLDSRGRLIGINAMIFNAGGTSASAGLGFSIPVNTVKDIVPQIIQFGKVVRPGLGIAVLEEQVLQRFFGMTNAVAIRYVDPKGSAAKAGLQGITRDRRGQYYLGDLIIGVNNETVKNFDDLYSALAKYKVGDTVNVKIIREKKEKVVPVKLIQI